MSAECPICHKTFRTRRKLKKHYRRAHRKPLPHSRGIFGVEGVKGKRIIDEKQKYSSALTFADNAKRQVALGNAVTFGKTSEQFNNLQDAIYEIAKTSSYTSHGRVIITPDLYEFDDTIDIPPFVDLISPGRAYFITYGAYNFRILPPDKNFGMSNEFQGFSLWNDQSLPCIRIASPLYSSDLFFTDCEITGIDSLDSSEEFDLHITAVLSTFVNYDITYDCTSAGSLHISLLNSFLRDANIVSHCYLAIESLNSHFRECGVISDGSRGFSMFFQNSCLYYPFTDRSPFYLTEGKYSVLNLYNSIVIGHTYTIERVGSGTIDVYTAENKLNVGYSPGVTEHISPTNNITDTDFEQAFRYFGFTFHFP